MDLTPKSYLLLLAAIEAATAAQNRGSVLDYYEAMERASQLRKRAQKCS